ncbi:hypothetical protein, partial [Pseudomonas sp. AB12(2023)]|uniref:hypothetical protein n=1 Tax=Pseudomonas sp. AB12(2023) TaxID=3048597 RepID=UPI002B22B95F
QMSSIQATEGETSTFLRQLESISHQQMIICGQLDELILLMQMPSESVLKVLEDLLQPMEQTMTDLSQTITQKLKEK